MGVTYKLKDEIIEFILRQKRDNPHISCRKLVVAIQTAFGLNVSKSSINAVIKDAQLSSPVGRSPTDLSRTKKFTIPKEKKVQLFGDEFSVPNKDVHEKQSETQNSSSAPALAAEPNEQVQRQILPPVDPPAPIFPQDIKNEEFVDVQSNLPRDPESSESSEIEEKVTLKGDVVEAQSDLLEETFELKDTRPFFMRMALWEFFSKPVLEEFLKRHTSLGENEIRIVDVLTCLAPGILSDPSEALDPKNVWLWKLSGWETLPEKDDVEAVIKFLITTKIPKFDYLLELGYFCSLVGAVKVMLSNNQHVFLDGRYRSVDLRANKAFPVCPIERAVEETTRFIDGNEILTLRCETKERFKGILVEFYAGLSLNHENLIKKIILLGMQDDQLLEFEHIPGKPRNFIISAEMSVSDFETVFEMPLEFIPEQVLGLPGAQYMFSDKTVDLVETINGIEFNFSGRMVIFDRQELGVLEVSVTNIPRSVLSAKELETMVRVPRQQKRFEGKAVDRISTGPESFLLGDEGELTIGQAIENLIKIIEENMNLMLLQTGKEGEYFSNTCNQKGCVVFGQRLIKFLIKSTAGSAGQIDNDFSEVLSIYRKTTYDGRKIAQYY